ncbi:SDR family NAD(P)-dependent oxidoreductase [Amycolatopsis sp. NPDC058278]|uniref:SDR family NAD(P)-dependent oxidoreductase n=1 Tax=Amycolatopsis sp. NPDC058278 TaxID=3346417 RepID=UPI0036D76A7C
MPTAELDLVCAEVAALLGGRDSVVVDVDKSFQDFGIRGRRAAELVARLSSRSGVSLPASLVFDYPTPAGVARYLGRRLSGLESSAATTVQMDSGEPVAIIGMSCRLPGGVASPDEFWRLVAGEVDAISGPPADRGWELAGKPYSGMGGFLHSCADFDAPFFGIGPSEALTMDPQQRLLLETAWEAVESARIDPRALRGSRTAVYAGVSTQDYGPGVVNAPEDTAGSLFLGTVNSVASGRVAYTLGLEGPTVTVDTACSSSLVALHWAARSLRSGECELALAGGVAVMCTPALPIAFSEMRATAEDGRCRAFAATANGTGWSEGAGFLLLEKLSDARRLGHRILAVVRGSAINQDGASNGLTAPNGPAQQRVIRQALANAGLSGSDVDVVEAHGTGTKLGDPIEAQALLAVYGQDRTTPFLLGSVKSNIGHTQAAAGVAGVIKMILAMRHGWAPKTLHVDEPTPKVDWTAGSARLLTAGKAWPETGRPRRSAVSSFGAGGTNVHVVLEQAPDDTPASPPSTGPGGVLPWVLSGRSAEALRAQAARLGEFVRDRPELLPADIALSLTTTRSDFEHRAVVLGHDKESLLNGLTSIEAGVPDAAVVLGAALPQRHGAVLVFPGQGSQWAGMAAGLLEDSEVFAGELAACDEALARYVPFSVRDVLQRRLELERVEVLQPVLFAVMVSLAAMWRAAGMRVAGVVGHSQGEVAAAYVAGALGLGDAARIVAVRSRLVAESLSGKGGMVSVSLPEAAVRGRLAGWPGAGVAAVNGPDSVVVSGTDEALAELLAQWETEGVRARRIAVDYASHSVQVDALEDRLRRALAAVKPRRGVLPFWSTVTGDLLDTEALDADYWFRNLREPVAFHRAVRALADQGFGTFIEVSPHPVLVMPIEQILAETPVPATVVGSLRRNVEDVAAFQQALATVHVSGQRIRWDAVLPPANVVDLPTYAFQRTRFWLEHREAGPLLDRGVRSPASGEWVFRGRVSWATHLWLVGHAVRGTVFAAGSMVAELVLRAGERAGWPRVEELVLHTPMVLREDETREICVVVTRERRATVYSGVEGEEPDWVEHASATLGATTPAAQHSWAMTWPPPGAEVVEVADVYERFAAGGYEYGPAFRGLRTAWRRGGEIFAEVALPVSGSDGFGVHPALLDAALHAWTMGMLDGGPIRLPFTWTGVSLHAVGAKALRVRLIPGGGDGCAVEAADGSGRPVLSVDSLVAREIDTAALGTSGTEDLYAVEWLEHGAADKVFTRWEVVGSDPFGVAQAIVHAGAEVTSVSADLTIVSLTTAPVFGSDTAQDVGERVLELVQQWCGDHPPSARLLVVTRGAVAASADDSVENPAQAVAWGLIRTAQTEHPGRFLLADVDHDDASVRALPAALHAGEPQLALRRGVPLVPRLRRLPVGESSPPVWPKQGTVLIVGGTGALGAEVARHLVAEHAVPHLVLVGRRAGDAGELRDELVAAGAESVRLASCDAADRAALARVLGEIPAEHPLTGVVHAAGLLDDGTLDSLTPERIRGVFRAKVDVAVNLHELTAGRQLSAFVLFSSLAGLLGTAGQGNYAAANAFLDALAAHRRARGLAGSSLAWGFWARRGELTRHLGDEDVARLTRSGVTPLSTEDGLRLLDRAHSVTRSLVVPARLDLLALPRMAPGPLTRRATAAPRTVGGSGPDLRARLAALPEAEREPVLVNLVREHVAAVLGYAEPTLIGADRGFQDLGFDSLKAVELRNRLAAAAGIRLPVTVVFTYPSPTHLAAHLAEELGPAAGPAAQDEELAGFLADIPVDRLRRAGLLDTLLALAGRTGSPAAGPNELDEMSADELIRAALER